LKGQRVKVKGKGRKRIEKGDRRKGGREKWRKEGNESKH